MGCGCSSRAEDVAASQKSTTVTSNKNNKNNTSSSSTTHPIHSTTTSDEKKNKSSQQQQQQRQQRHPKDLETLFANCRQQQQQVPPLAKLKWGELGDALHGVTQQAALLAPLLSSVLDEGAATRKKNENDQKAANIEAFGAALAALAEFRSRVGASFFHLSGDDAAADDGRVQDHHDHCGADCCCSFEAEFCDAMDLDATSAESALGLLMKCVDVVIGWLMMESPMLVFCHFPPSVCTPSQNSGSSTSPLLNNKKRQVDVVAREAIAAVSALPEFQQVVSRVMKENNESGRDAKQQQQQQHRLVRDMLQQGSSSSSSDEKSKSWNFLADCLGSVFEVSSFLMSHKKNNINKNNSDATQKATSSAALSHIIGQSIYKFIGDPSAGMVAVMTLEQQLEGIATLLACLGTFSSSSSSSSSSCSCTWNGGDFHTWCAKLPLPLLDSQAVAVLFYCGCILTRQNRMNVEDIKRVNVLKHLEREMCEYGNSCAASFRIFPVFEKEAGEGHGPRKDFFTRCCEALSQSTGFPQSAASAGGLKLHASSEGGSSEVVVTAAKVSPLLRPGTALVIRDNNSSNNNSNNNKSSSLETAAAPTMIECTIVEQLADASKTTLSIVDAFSPEENQKVHHHLRLSRILPTTTSSSSCSSSSSSSSFELVSIAAPQMPCFDSDGRSVLYFNGRVNDVCCSFDGVDEKNDLKTFARICEAKDANQVGSPAWNSKNYFMAGWLLGTAVVNGVPLVGLGLPEVFFTILKKMAIIRLTNQHHSSCSSASANNNDAIVMTPKDFTVEHLLQVNESMQSAVDAIRNMKKDDLVSYVEGIILLDEDENETETENPKPDSHQDQTPAPTTAAEALLATASASCRPLSLKESQAIIANCASDAEAAEFVISRHVVFPALYEDAKKRWAAVTAGFCASTLPTACSLAFFKRVHPAQLHACCTGASVDSATSDFSWSNSFNIVFDQEFSKHRHSFAFRKVVSEVVFFLPQQQQQQEELPHSKMMIEFKRKVLHFITGRMLVPPGKKSETISIALVPTAAEWKVGDIGSLTKTLPTAHTCTNTLELPNYFEAFALEELVTNNGNNDNNNNNRTVDPSARVNDESLRQRIWGMLTEEQRNSVRAKTSTHLRRVMSTAAFEGLTFELDEMESGGGAPAARVAPSKKITSTTTNNNPLATSTAMMSSASSPTASSSTPKPPARTQPVVALLTPHRHQQQQQQVTTTTVDNNDDDDEYEGPAEQEASPVSALASNTSIGGGVGGGGVQFHMPQEQTSTVSRGAGGGAHDFDDD